MSTARSIGTATISFGLVAVPVKLYSTNESADEISFNMLHATDNARLKQQYVCTACNEVVDKDHTIKGYEHAKGQFVTFTTDELKAIEATATQAIEIVECVDGTLVDPTYVEKTYYLAPDKGADRGYQLLCDALIDTGYVAIARWSARGKEHLVMLRPVGDASGDGLAVHQLRHEHEVKRWEAVPPRRAVDVLPAELALAKQLLLEIASDTFAPGKYTDRVHDAMKAMLDAKIAGNEIVTPPASASNTTLDLVAALKQSLGVSAESSAPAAPPETSQKVVPRKRAAKVAKTTKAKRTRAA